MYIIATIGPKSFSKAVIKEFVEKGVSALRFNCSHFSKEEFLKVIKYARELNKDIHIIGDLCGRKIRVSEELKEVYRIYPGEEVFFCGEDFYESIDPKGIKDMKLIPLTIKSETISNNNIESISMKDNTMRFDIVEKKQGIIKTKVKIGGVVRGGKGCNIPNIVIKDKELCKKDKADIKWLLDNNIDIICQSYVECREDLLLVDSFIKKTKASNSKVELWGKVETPRGINNLEAFLDIIDTVVIGRGDLVPEAGLLQAVNLQFKCIDRVLRENKKVIVATHILDSFKIGEIATINEVEGIYTFIRYGVAGFLLAGETSVGKYPIKTVEFLREVIEYYKNLR